MRRRKGREDKEGERKGRGVGIRERRVDKKGGNWKTAETRERMKEEGRGRRKDE